MKSNLQSRINQADHFIIIGPQKFSSASFKKTLTGLDPVVAIYVDGGTRHQRELEKNHPEIKKNSFSIGDGDSSKSELTFKKRDQSISDLAYLLQKLSRKTKIKTVHFFGFVEKSTRLDHVLVNLGEIMAFHAERKTALKLSCDNKIVFLKKETFLFSTKKTFSVIVLKPGKIKISGECRFPFEGKLMPLSSRGLSNEGQGVISIRVPDQALLILS